VALWAYALSTVEQAKKALVLKDDRHDAVIEACVNEASQMVEDQWGRHIVSRGSLTEYHPRNGGGLGAAIYVNEWPIISVTTIHEDSNRAYDATTLLTVDTDYIISKPIGEIVRVSSSLPLGWEAGWRAIKIVYLGGYQDVGGTISGAAALPHAVKRVFFELVAWMVRQRTGGEVGMTQVQDGFGNRTFSGPAYITPAMAAALSAAGALAPSLAGRTGERDA